MLHETRWTIRKIAQRLDLIAPMVHRRTHEIPAFRFLALDSPSDPPPVGMDVDDSQWEVIEPRTYWGGWFLNYVLRSEFEVPADFDKNSPIMLYLPLGNSGDFSHPESQIYINGKIYGANDRHHQEVLLTGDPLDGNTHKIALHGWTGLGGYAGGEEGTKLFMRPCAVVQVDQPTRDFIALARVAHGTVKLLEDADPARTRLMNALVDAFNVLDTRDTLGEDFYDTVPAALEALQKGVEQAGDPLDVDVVAAGHAHIDVAWLWTLGQTRRKSARTFSTALRLMEEFPDYHFSQSQPQLYQYIEEDHPELFEQIKERVKEGRWEIMGGAWVEPDINAIGAESLARQFLLGRNYFHKHFGDIDTPVLWLPDTFGYAWALPQLIKEAGMKYFVTHKMSWNQFNRMPYQSMWWQGLDGTKVLTHFLTSPDAFGTSEFLPYATTYNTEVSSREIRQTWTNYLQKETHNELITAYGYGDGGGGPTREQLENIQVMKNHPGLPRMRPGTVKEFLDNLEDRAGDKLPTWNGEFYLEYHRGTYTSQAKNKRNNRKSEFLLHDAEFLATVAALITDYDYPYETINKAWELVCLNHFHDILPGSSIGPVYVDSDKDYAKIREMGEAVRDAALQALAAAMPNKATLAAVNPTSFGGAKVGILPEALADGQSLVNSATGEALLTQVSGEETLVLMPETQPYSMVPLETDDSTPQAEGILSATTEGDLTVLENDFVRVEFDKAGDITRLYDKVAHREVLAEGEKGNQLQTFEDRPMMFDAWDIDIYFDDRMWLVDDAYEVSITETGPVRVGITVKRNFRSSMIEQKIYLYRHSAQLDFESYVDWHEHHILLKVAFPVNVLNPMATHEIQWGNVQRATHRNTSWDWARFETCAYKWVDLSEGNYGVSLLNDCKHGHDVWGNVIRQTLIKSATSPDPDADQGDHYFTYSLLPHTGDWQDGNTTAHAYTLNDPMIIRRLAGTSEENDFEDAFVSVDAPNVIIETVKRAEDNNGIIVRLYEFQRNRGPITLKTGFELQSAYLSNIMEEDQAELGVVDDTVTFEITPYQIVTLRLVAKTN